MSRPRLHAIDDLLDVAEQLATTGDPAGLTLRALGVSAGASSGTIYHAFRSKDDLLARVWLRSWSRLAGLMEDALPGETQSGGQAVVAVALAPCAFVQRFPASAKIFLGQRRDQLFNADDLPDEIREDLNRAREQFVRLMVNLAERTWGRGDRIAVETISVCIVDLPGGILRRTMLEGRPATDVIARQIEAAVGAILSLPLDPPHHPATKEH